MFGFLRHFRSQVLLCTLYTRHKSGLQTRINSKRNCQLSPSLCGFAFESSSGPSSISIHVAEFDKVVRAEPLRWISLSIMSIGHCSGTFLL
jgi:hypothetical protein